MNNLFYEAWQNKFSSKEWIKRIKGIEECDNVGKFLIKQISNLPNLPDLVMEWIEYSFSVEYFPIKFFLDLISLDICDHKIKFVEMFIRYTSGRRCQIMLKDPEKRLYVIEIIFNILELMLTNLESIFENFDPKKENFYQISKIFNNYKNITSLILEMFGNDVISQLILISRSLNINSKKKISFFLFRTFNFFFFLI